ncbi:PsiA protein [Providencia alcalifaciens]|uniref:PsiA protein n=1 Tax=Providencia alcalifaciens TaxID=126385 RepID=A0A4R3NF56_9GAMM|nr:plasmid SOS inhibition protein A [Providencia alcalifaciens]TCT28915.1 PsiA protein [Providencia alcalifaciens]
MTTIPNHLALVPFNDRQYAAAKAIIHVEDKIEKGHYQKRYPYACALIRFFTGNTGAITCDDLKITLILAFDDKRAMPSKNRYLAALDTFIQSRGLVCPLPLSDRNVRDFFPERYFRDCERQDRKIQSHNHVESRARQKAQIKVEQQYQNRLAQAEIELAFITPSEFKSWYNRFNRDGIHDYDLIELLVNWTQRFSSLNLRKYLDFALLWSALLDFYDEIDTRSYGEQLLDGYAIPNKLTR